MKSFTAGPNENGVRLSRFVEGVTKDMPRSMMYKAFRNKRIKVNGKRAEPDTRLSAGDLIELYINDEFFPVGKPAAKTAKPRRQPPVTVVYEDENFAVLYKPAHLLCHSDHTGDANLVDAFAAYLEAKGEYDPHAEKRFAPALCNRLDRGTEGLVLAAKSYAALRDLNAIIRDDMMKKEYLTITVGAPPQGRFVAWLQHSETNNKVRIHARESEGYKQIITEVTVIRQAGPFALCRIGLITGRTHQIRAHLAYLGHPVLGDIKYGNHKMNERTGLKTQALCAQRLTFGRIPEENTLQYLSGRVIKLNGPEIVKTYERLTAEK
ncbi:MAG: RluA family pseudouridine synthase [Gemmiger formicilis]|uniref:RluA family pseudouridine synthase n=1 Tax=Gemmiger formicilis TaxID=745368 RepID=UPI003FEE42B6|nr:RluA family pseudouridine synthase [Gemmiger formicilis]